MPKSEPPPFFVILFFAAVTMAISVMLPRECVAQNYTSSLSGQSGGDPNRPPSAQNPRSVPQHPPVTAAEKSSTEAPSGDEKILFDHVNESRVLAGLAALRWDANLAAAARKHCALLVQHEALSHQFPGEEDLKERARQAGAAFSALAENVALAATPDEIHYEWMHSPPHRANILDPELTTIGIAEMPGNKGLYAVQDFSRAVENLTLQQQEEKMRALIVAAGVRNADSPGPAQWSDARKACQVTNGNVGRSSTFVKFDSSDLNQLPARLKSLLASGKYSSAAVGACDPGGSSDGFTHYRIAVLLY